MVVQTGTTMPLPTLIFPDDYGFSPSTFLVVSEAMSDMTLIATS